MTRPTVAIREYRADDQDQVIALWERCDLPRPWNDPVKDIARKLRVRPDLFLVGVLDGNVVTTVMGGYDGHRGWINYLAVDPGVRRLGVGRAMMLEIETRLDAEGCPKINLQVRPFNREGLAFYAALGYVADDVVSLGRRLEFDA